MKSYNFNCTSPAEAEAKVSEIITNGFVPTLGLVFSSVSIDYLSIRDMLGSKGIQVYGATSAGEISNGEVAELSVSIMLMDIDTQYFRLILSDSHERSTWDASMEIANIAKAEFDSSAVIVSSGGVGTDGEEIIRGIQHVLGNNVPIYGGLAGDDFQMKETFVFTQEGCTNEGLLGLILDTQHIEVSGIASSGWDPVGIEKTITKSVGNIVYSIDGEPAADVFVDYFGLNLDLENTNGVLDAIGVSYPLHVARENGESVIRTPLMGNEEDRSLVFAGTVPQGAKVKFCIPPGFDVIEKTISETRELRDAFPEADALLLFSCKARHVALGPIIEDEVRGLQELWDAPLTGFFTYGEIGSIEGKACDFHNETCCLVVLKEK